MSKRWQLEPIPDVPLPMRKARAWLEALEAEDRARPEGWHDEARLAVAAGCTPDESWNALVAGVEAGTLQVTFEAPPARCWVRMTPLRERRIT
jgi:hypothetical protein